MNTECPHCGADLEWVCLQALVDVFGDEFELECTRCGKRLVVEVEMVAHFDIRSANKEDASE